MILEQVVKKSHSGSTKWINNVYFNVETAKTYAAAVLLKNYYEQLDEDNVNSIAYRMRMVGFSRTYLTNVLNTTGNLCCSYCPKTNLIIELDGMKVSNYRKATVDHIIPISKGGGPFDLNNLCVACGTCNSKKGDKLVEDFRKISTKPITMNVKVLSFGAMSSGVPKDMPFELLEEVSTWDMIIKSPYGFSYYNKPVSWDYKEDKSLRIADHWNFISKNKSHCQTETPVENNTHWTLARFNSLTGKYEVIKTYKKQPINIKKTLDFNLLLLEHCKTKAIEKLNKTVLSPVKINENLSRLELKFLNKYFKVLEEFA